MTPDRAGSLSDVTVRIERVGSAGPSPRTYTRIACITGEPHRPPFVLVPGIGMGVGIFERLAPRLLVHGDVYALDLPGFAGIRVPRRALSVEEYARLVGEALDHLELDDPVVIGHSMGTQIVTELAAARPALSRIVLISPVVPPALRTVPRVALAFAGSSLREPAGVVLLAIVSYLFTGLRSFAATLPRMLRHRPEERIGEVNAAVLIVRGQCDAVAPRRWLRELAGRALSATSAEIPHAAHSVMHRQAGQVARLIVGHAGSPEASDPPVEVQRLEARGMLRWTLRLRTYALVARSREIAAIIRGDDNALARAKTSRVRTAIVAGDARPAG